MSIDPLLRGLLVSMPLVLGGCSERVASPDGGVKALRLVYQNNVNGDTEPCG